MKRFIEETWKSHADACSHLDTGLSKFAAYIIYVISDPRVNFLLSFLCVIYEVCVDIQKTHASVGISNLVSKFPVVLQPLSDVIFTNNVVIRR